MKLNNKGFTLVELLAVLVILTAIMGLAIPTITSSLERSKEKQTESKIEMLESFAELYVTDHKSSVYDILSSKNVSQCFIEIENAAYKEYLTEDASVDADGNPIVGYIIFNKNNNSYKYENTLPSAVSESCI